MIAAVGTVAGVFLVDVEAEDAARRGHRGARCRAARGRAPTRRRRGAIRLDRGRSRRAAARRSMLSNDGGATWREAGGGLPPGFAVAIAEDDPDRMLYAARNRLYVSANGGVFWSSLPFELPDIDSVGWID